MKRANTALISLAILVCAGVFSACTSSDATTATTMATIGAATPMETVGAATPAGTPTGEALEPTPTAAPTEAAEENTPAPTPTEAATNNNPPSTSSKTVTNKTTSPTKSPPPPTSAPKPPEDTDNGSTLPTANCVARLQEAESVAEADRYIELYYPALKECTGLEDWVEAVSATSALKGKSPIVWAAETCALDGPMTSVTCQQAIAAARNSGDKNNDNGTDDKNPDDKNTDNGSTPPTANCVARLQEAEAVGEAGANFEAYYPALKECTGLEDWVESVSATSALRGQDPIRWAAETCALDGPMTLITCRQAIAAARNSGDKNNDDGTGDKNNDDGVGDKNNDDGTALPTANCVSRLQEAESVSEADRYIELYYPALKECTGLEDWVEAVSVTSALRGQDPIRWASKVCGVDGPMTSVTCRQAMAAAPIG